MLNDATPAPADRAGTDGATARPLRIALMSEAHVHAGSYAHALSHRDDVELIVADPDGYGEITVGERVGTYEEAFDHGLDAIVVCTTNAGHRDLVLEAARRGVHVLCEKPLATTVADAEAMVTACRDAGVVLMTAFPVSFAPQVDALRTAVRDGRLGRVIGFTGTNNGQLPRGRDWFTRRAESGGGALVDHVVHVAQILDSIVGPPATVHAVANRILWGGRTVDDVETGGLVTLTWEDGTVATIDCSWSMPEDAPRWGGLTVQAVGTGGTLSIDAFSEHVGGPGQWLPLGADLDGMLVGAFLEAVRHGQAVEPTGDAGLRAVRIVEAAQRSVATGEVVRL